MTWNVVEGKFLSVFLGSCYSHSLQYSRVVHDLTYRWQAFFLIQNLVQGSTNLTKFGEALRRLVEALSVVTWRNTFISIKDSTLLPFPLQEFKRGCQGQDQPRRNWRIKVRADKVGVSKKMLHIAYSVKKIIIPDVRKLCDKWVSRGTVNSVVEDVWWRFTSIESSWALTSHQRPMLRVDPL